MPIGTSGMFPQQAQSHSHHYGRTELHLICVKIFISLSLWRCDPTQIIGSVISPPPWRVPSLSFSEPQRRSDNVRRARGLTSPLTAGLSGLRIDPGTVVLLVQCEV